MARSCRVRICPPWLYKEGVCILNFNVEPSQFILLIYKMLRAVSPRQLLPGNTTRINWDIPNIKGVFHCNTIWRKKEGYSYVELTLLLSSLLLSHCWSCPLGILRLAFLFSLKILQELWTTEIFRVDIFVIDMWGNVQWSCCCSPPVHPWPWVDYSDLRDCSIEREGFLPQS